MTIGDAVTLDVVCTCRNCNERYTYQGQGTYVGEKDGIQRFIVSGLKCPECGADNKAIEKDILIQQ